MAKFYDETLEFPLYQLTTLMINWKFENFDEKKLGFIDEAWWYIVKF